LEIVFNEKYWGLIMLFSILIAFGITFLLYFRSRDGSELTPWQRRLLITLRFLSVFSAAVMLTGPLIKTLRRVIQNPVIIVAIDNSSSVTGIRNKEAKGEEISSMISSIGESLSGKYEVVSYTFGEEVRRNYTPDFTEKRSAYSDVIQAVYNNHFNENVGAMLLIGDGIFNKGENPIYSARQLTYPVYTLALGDTTQHRDVRISDVRVNRNAFFGNKFPVEVDIIYQGMPGQNLRFSIKSRGETIYNENIYTGESNGFRTVTTLLDAQNKGLQFYTVLVESAVDEQNTINNSQQFVINVLENKQKILIISNGVHPDAGAIKDALESRVNYEVSLFSEEPYPANMKDYNLIVLNQIPSAAQSGRLIFEEANRQRIPILIVIGSQTHIPQFNLIGKGIEINLQAGNMEEAQPVINKSFVTFTLSEKLAGNLERYPPLKAPFAQYQLDHLWNVILFQRLRNIETDRPLMAISNRNGIKAGVIFGEGIWRWRMYNYLMSDSHEEFTELIDKLVQYLANRDNEDNFIVGFKPVYNETESILMTAEVYNDAFEPINTPEVNLIIRDSLKQEYTYLFDRGNQFYRLDAGLFPPGEYHFEAKVEIGNVTYTESGHFAVMPVNIELMETEANHRMLYQLAWQSGGGFYLPNQSNEMVNDILSNTRIKPFSYFQTLLNEILNLRWIFFVILFILSLEWFLRKFWGIY